METIYLDHAATTPVLPEVVEAMTPYLKQQFGNPSGDYHKGIEARKAIEHAREIIAYSIHAEPQEIYFTSGGTESDNWAIKMVCEREDKKRAHVVTSQIEHHAVLCSCRAIKERGTIVTYLPVDEKGSVRVNVLEQVLRNHTNLVSVMYANNEVGTIQPIRALGALCRERGVWFHTDAVQAYGHIPIDVQADGIDMLSASAHKFYGPKGVGFLYLRKEIPLSSFLNGGGQERGRRAGTENVAGIVGMGKAAEIAMVTMEEEKKRLQKMREHLISRLLYEIPFTQLNGEKEQRLPGNCSVRFAFVDGANLVKMLDAHGICASVGSACSSGSRNPSHVLMAMGVPEKEARGTLRLTLGKKNTMVEIDLAADVIRACVEKLREEEAFREE